MSLRWNIENIPDWQNACRVPTEDGGHKLSDVTHTIIMSSMWVEAGGLVEETVEEWVLRLTTWEKLLGTTMMDIPEGDGPLVPRYITEEEIRAHVGLTVNVSYKPRKEWLEHVLRQSFPKANHPLRDWDADYEDMRWDGQRDRLVRRPKHKVDH